jgi:hypothetical protein
VVEQVVHELGLDRDVVVGVAEEQGEPARAQFPLDALDHRGEGGVDDVGDKQPNRLGGLSAQGSGDPVSTVTEALRGDSDPGDQLRVHRLHSGEGTGDGCR